MLKKEEVAYHLSDSEAKACFAFVGTAELPMAKENYAGFLESDSCKHFFIITSTFTDASPIQGIETLGMLISGQSAEFTTAQTGAEDTAVIIYTSGTTGKPKGAELTHSNLLLNAILSTNVFKTDKDDTQLIVLPMFHIFAMTCLMNAGVYRGATSVLLPRFDTETVLSLMTQHSVSIFGGVPTMYWGLVNYENKHFDLEAIGKNLKVCISGGASLPVKILEDFESLFKTKILEGYGMSEGSPVVTFNQMEIGVKPGSIGVPVWGVEVKIVDTNGNEVPVGEKGELIYRGHNVTKGYYKKPEANAQTIKEGWMHSGDVAVKDEDGFFYIVDRTKDMIIRGGLNVYPREVEEVMMKHEAVSMVAVIGVPNEKFGEEVKAYVVLKEEGNVTAKALIRYAKSNLAAYKYPRYIEFLENLPMSATGKILKKALRNRD